MLILFCTGSSWTASANMVLYCTQEISTGLVFKDGAWKRANFKPERFALKVVGDWQEINKGDDKLSCYHSGEFKGYFPVICRNTKKWITQTINIDKYSLRFVYTNVSIGGYASTLSEPDTDEIAAGKCENF